MAKDSDNQKKKRRGAPPQYLFKPGQSGNPAGRPKKENTVTSMIKLYLDDAFIDSKTGGKKFNEDGTPMTNAQVLGRSLVLLAANGNSTAIQAVLERTEGKVPQKLEHGGVDGDPSIKVSVKNRDKIKKIFENEELAEAAEKVAIALHGSDDTD